LRDFLTALGLMLAIEGTLYAAFAGRLREWALQVSTLSAGVLRVGGVVALAVGVGLVWLSRG
jgi:uncharacterized protein YjeT (DUF2065 family)